ILSRDDLAPVPDRPLALLVAVVAPANVSHRYARSEPRDQGRPRSRQTPCPATGSTAGPCPGYGVDHIMPLKRGGADSPENMQWQTRDEAKAKDRVEQA